VKRALVKRLVNEYLDGEIGLADKAELERLMAEDPQIRAEYKALRQIGLQLSSLPEVVPHPQRFRARVQDALDQQQRVYLTPQRVFAGAMLVALVVLSVGFGMLLFQEGMLGDSEPAPAVMEAAPPVLNPGDAIAVLDVNASADRFFSRVLVESQLGLIDRAVLDTVNSQTPVYEGAVCTGNSLEALHLAYPVHVVQMHAAPSVAQQLSMVAEEVSGRPSPIAVTIDGGSMVAFEQHLRANPGQRTVSLLIRFK
jgi:anti-sigma factor RsiW